MFRERVCIMSGNYNVKKLTDNLDMKCTYIVYGAEWWEGEILYTFIPAFKVEEMMPQVFADEATLMVWMSSSHNAVIASKADKREFTQE